MGYLSVSNVNGEQLVVHGAFKGELERIIKKCWNASSQASKEEVLKTLAKDSYLVFDDKLASIKVSMCVVSNGMELLRNDC